MIDRVKSWLICQTFSQQPSWGILTNIYIYIWSLGKEHNFNTYDDTTSSSLGVPYDYGSMMHYSKNAFRKGTEPTIVTKIPAFSDVIGQRMEFSDSDLLKLHRLYNCSKSQQPACCVLLCQLALPLL